MTETTLHQPIGQQPAAGFDDQPKSRRRRGGSGGRGGRPPEQPEPRPARSRGDRSPRYGWGDGLDRCLCAARLALHAESSPVQHRNGLATLAMRIVAQGDAGLLLCEGNHDGPHLWPDGMPADTLDDDEDLLT